MLALGIETEESIVILDDAAARTAARSLGLTVTGTLGVLVQAKRLHLVDAVGPVIDGMVRKGFHVDAATREAVLRMAGELV